MFVVCFHNTQWGDSMQFVGLYELMYNKSTGLIRQHPGCVPLVKEHKEIIDKAYKEFCQLPTHGRADGVGLQHI